MMLKCGNNRCALHDKNIYDFCTYRECLSNEESWMPVSLLSTESHIPEEITSCPFTNAHEGLDV